MVWIIDEFSCKRFISHTHYRDGKHFAAPPPPMQITDSGKFGIFDKIVQNTFVQNEQIRQNNKKTAYGEEITPANSCSIP